MQCSPTPHLLRHSAYEPLPTCKSWWYDFWYHGECYRGCIGSVSKTVAKEILATKKAEAVKGRYELSSKKPSPRLGDFVKDYFASIVSGTNLAWQLLTVFGRNFQAF